MNRYKDKFDHLGRMRSGDYMPWTTADKIIMALCVVCVLAFLAGQL